MLMMAVFCCAPFRRVGLPDSRPALDAPRLCSQEDQRHTQTQAATWLRACAEKEQQLALRNQQVAELRRRDDDRQRHVDCLLTQNLQMELRLTAMEVSIDGLAYAAVFVHAWYTCRVCS